MPNAATRLADAAVFFKFYLKRMRPHNRDVFVTSDRSAALVTSIVRKGDGAYNDNVRYLPHYSEKSRPWKNISNGLRPSGPMSTTGMMSSSVPCLALLGDRIVSFIKCIEDV